MIYDVNSPLFRSFLSQKGGSSDKRLFFLSLSLPFYSNFYLHICLVFFVWVSMWLTWMITFIGSWISMKWWLISWFDDCCIKIKALLAILMGEFKWEILSSASFGLQLKLDKIICTKFLFQLITVCFPTIWWQTRTKFFERLLLSTTWIWYLEWDGLCLICWNT